MIVRCSFPACDRLASSRAHATEPLCETHYRALASERGRVRRESGANTATRRGSRRAEHEWVGYTCVRCFCQRSWLLAKEPCTSSGGSAAAYHWMKRPAAQLTRDEKLRQIDEALERARA